MENIIKHLQGKKEVLLLDNEQLLFNITTQQKNIEENNYKIDRINNQIAYLSTSNNINLKDCFTPEEIKEYSSEPNMLFELGMDIRDWLSWFYDELPFIKDKKLQFIGMNTDKHYSILKLKGEVLVLNHKLIVNMSEPVEIQLPNIDLYKILSI